MLIQIFPREADAFKICLAHSVWIVEACSGGSCIFLFIFWCPQWRLINTQEIRITSEVFSEIVEFFRFDMWSKPNFAQNIKRCSRLLEPKKLPPTAKVTQKLPSAIGTGLMATPFTTLVLFHDSNHIDHLSNLRNAIDRETIKLRTIQAIEEIARTHGGVYSYFKKGCRKKWARDNPER